MGAGFPRPPPSTGGSYLRIRSPRLLAVGLAPRRQIQEVKPTASNLANIPPSDIQRLALKRNPALRPPVDPCLQDSGGAIRPLGSSSTALA
jgi:hypothetical protein